MLLGWRSMIFRRWMLRSLPKKRRFLNVLMRIIRAQSCMKTRSSFKNSKKSSPKSSKTKCQRTTPWPQNWKALVVGASMQPCSQSWRITTRQRTFSAKSKGRNIENNSVMWKRGGRQMLRVVFSAIKKWNMSRLWDIHGEPMVKGIMRSFPAVGRLSGAWATGTKTTIRTSLLRS